MTAYDRDFHGWAHAQAEALRRRSANEIDWENVAEEIEGLGKQQLSELRNRLEVLILHLLKWAYQPDRRGRSCVNSVAEQRRWILEHIDENPSLKPMLSGAFDKAYRDARFSASNEILGEPEPDMFPTRAPFTAQEALEPDWFPEPVSVTPEAPPR